MIPAPLDVVAGSTIKGSSVEERRAAANLLRSAAGLTLFSFTDPAPAGTEMKALHIVELHSAITQAFIEAGAPAPPFSPVQPGDPIRAIDFNAIGQAIR